MCARYAYDQTNTANALRAAHCIASIECEVTTNPEECEKLTYTLFIEQFVSEKEIADNEEDP